MKKEILIKEFEKKGLSQSEVVRLMDIAKTENDFRRYAQRRLFKEPFEYIEGKVKFFDRYFGVDRRVYVPNPETEKMVKGIMGFMISNSRVLDVGTGSGCIAITLAKEFPKAKIYASDIDPNALSVAKINADKNGAKVNFFESNYVDDLEFESPDFVISDLPYGSEAYTLPSIDFTEFKHMPPQACFHPKGILNAYEELVKSIKRKGWKTILFFESGRISKEEVSKIIPSENKWKYVELEDYSYTIVYFE